MASRVPEALPFTMQEMSPGRSVGKVPEARRWRLPYLLLLAGTLLTIGGVETVLLEVKYDYFTGGFLAVDVLRGAPQVLGFFTCAFVLDSFLILAIWTLLTPVLGRIGLTRPKTFVIAGLLTPIVPFAMDYVNYELYAYFKDMMDLRLIWELSGKSPKEILAEWAGQSVYAGVVVVVGVCLLIAAAKLAHKVALNSGQAGWTVSLPSLRTTCIAALVSGLAGVAILVAMTLSGSPIGFGLNRKPSGIVLRSLVQFLTDFDRDGYGLLSRPRETDYFNPRLHPYAIDIPGNGIDENGVGGDHPKDYIPGIAPPDEQRPWTRAPNVLLILLESFRADLTERRVNDREITPFINGLKSEGAYSMHAFSHCGYTVPSRAQLFSGRMLPYPGEPTLIDDFKRHGYFVAYFSGQDDSFGDSEPLLGYDKADVFYDARSDKDKRYSTFSTPASLAVSCKLVTRKVSEFLTGYTGSKPLFMYVNYHDTHFPYHHRELDNILGIVPVPQDKIKPGNQEAIWKTYANSAANVDRSIGTLLKVWKEKLAGRSEIVIITSDHAESVFENGFLGHGYSVEEEQTRIPFIVWGDAGTWYEPLGLADIRGQLLANLGAGRDGEPCPSRIVGDPARQVMQHIGPFRAPRFLAWRTLDELMVYDFWDDDTFFRKDGSREVERRTTGLDPRLIRLIWDWEAIVNEQALGPSAVQIKNGGKWSSPH